jgi:tetratricopeptide (TPR) repeat protein
MSRRYRPASGEGVRRKLTITLLQIIVMAVAVVSPWSHQLVEARGQSTPQIQIYDVGPGTNPPPAATSSASRLSELVTKEQWSEAAKLAQELARQEPNDPVVSYYLGLTLVHFHDPIGAIRALRTAERLGMDTAYFHQVLGIAYYNVHQFILFQQQMEKSIALAPADYKPYYYVGRYLESVRNDFPGALQYFAKATGLKPEHTESWYYEGYCLEVSGRHTEARSAYETAIKSIEKRHERFSLPYQGIARVLADKAPAQALEFACKAIELEPDLDSNHVIMAKVYERLGRFSEAMEELQTAERLDPTNASPRFMLARIYSKVGDRIAAEAELAMFKKIKEVYGSQ